MQHIENTIILTTLAINMLLGDAKKATMIPKKRPSAKKPYKIAYDWLFYEGKGNRYTINSKINPYYTRRFF